MLYVQLFDEFYNVFRKFIFIYIDESMTHIYCSFNFNIDREHKQLVDEPTSNEREKCNFRRARPTGSFSELLQ